MTAAELFDRGGPIVWVLAGYSILALTIVVERLLRFLRLGRPPRDLEARLGPPVGLDTVSALAGGLRGPEGAVLRGVLAASAAGVRDLGRVASRIGSQELQAMERGFRTLGILGNTAPLLGLLGTITGMIKAFMVIEQAGGRVDAQALAGGIWEAMVTTGVGLAVAIPILLALHFLEGMADRRALLMARCASVLLERLPHSDEAGGGEAVYHRREGLHAL